MCNSTLVPQHYQGQAGLSNCLIALEMANRMNTSPLIVMQNLNIIQGKPAWSSQFIIAMIQTRFDDLDYEMSGKGDSISCKCSAVRRSDKKKIYGSPVSLEMAKAEGWTRNSKWKTMPQLMLQYRAASFFGRQHVADLLLGVQTEEEVVDIQPMKVVTEEAKGQEGEPEFRDGKWRPPLTEEQKQIEKEAEDDFGF
ncbi:MAG TPA: hypothetical protein DF712_03450 [Balneola sp.]|nr:hypothetical protein [Balneola sp.]